jgi:hypothetical protein
MSVDQPPDPAERDSALAALDQYRALVDAQPTPIFDEIARRVQYDEHVDWRPAELTAVTAGEQDHSDPTRYMGDPADPPVNP